MPRYRSTRGGESVSFEEALLRGLAPDGGLYVPDSIPHVDFSGDSFESMSASVLEQWVGDEITNIDDAVRDAFDFPVPLIPLGGGLHVVELFHGPTLSFKDFGARMMARWMSRFLESRGEDVTILVATSGDTGSAVADGFAGQERIRVVLLYPKGKVSPVQERQLIVKRPGVRALAVEGDFDDCQRMVKEAFLDPIPTQVNLSSANSINIGRLLPQMLYYIWAARLLASEDVLFCVPSGNLGNLTGGVLAHLSGLPVHGFLAAHNANDFFPQFLSRGDAAFAPTKATLSNAMDVGAPSNFERLRA
ncbi:MAG: threonine synthase, partial [Rhodothermales bacterium]